MVTVRDAEKLLDKSPVRNAEWHQQKFNLYQEKHIFSEKRQRTGEQHLQALTDEHDAYYLIEKLRHACLIRSYQAVNKVEYDLGLLLQILSGLTKDYWQKWPVAGIYFNSFKMLSEADGSPFFQKVKMLLNEHHQWIPIFRPCGDF